MKGEDHTYIAVFLLHLMRQTDARLGGAVAEWSKALQLTEKTNENQNIPGSPHQAPGLGTL